MLLDCFGDVAWLKELACLACVQKRVLVLFVHLILARSPGPRREGYAGEQCLNNRQGRTFLVA